MHLILIFFCAGLLGFFAYSSAAEASILPVREVDGAYFPTTSDGIQVVSLNVTASPASFDDAGGGRFVWAVDTELRLRNVRTDAATHELALAVERGYEAQTEVFVRGQVASPRIGTVRHDPRYAQIAGGEMPVLLLQMDEMELVSLRIRTFITATTDSLGQTVFRYPVDTLRLFSGEIGHTTISLRLHERPVGLVASLRGYTFYDEPVNELTWFSLDWRPNAALEVAWLGAWSALVLVAEVEECPQPWALIHSVMRGEVGAARAALRAVDEPTLEFCMALPLVTHGFAFSSDLVRRNLSQLSVNRYVGGRTERGPLYRINPTFVEADLTQPERIYRTTLAQELESRANR